jgi:hypothetical protein
LRSSATRGQLARHGLASSGGSSPIVSNGLGSHGRKLSALCNPSQSPARQASIAAALIPSGRALSFLRLVGTTCLPFQLRHARGVLLRQQTA